MKLIQIWEKLGRQPLYITNHQDAYVFVGDEAYIITGIRYKDGKPEGFDAMPVQKLIDIERSEG